MISLLIFDFEVSGSSLWRVSLEREFRQMFLADVVVTDHRLDSVTLFNLHAKRARQ